MKEFNVARCPFCGSWNTEDVNEDFRQCQICGVAWDKIYQREDGKLIVHSPV